MPTSLRYFRGVLEGQRSETYRAVAGDRPRASSHHSQILLLSRCAQCGVLRLDRDAPTALT